MRYTPGFAQLLAIAIAMASPATADEGIHWSFEGPDNLTAAHAEDRIEGNYRFADGVRGQAMVFDGYTSAVRRSASSVPDLGEGFTVAGWLAVAAYPWAAVPIINQSRNEQRGFSFDVGPRGELMFSLVMNGRTLQATSDDYLLPHRNWSHVAARFDVATGLTVYLNGRQVASQQIPIDEDRRGRNPASRFVQAGELDILVGGVRQPVRPAAYHRHKGSRPSWIAFDGLMDEMSLFDKALTEEEIRNLGGQHATTDAGLPDRVMPSGPPGTAAFGAYQQTLSYYPEWDALHRIAEHADIVVRFDRTPARVVFWRGTQYSPAWVTGNGLWMADQSVEGYDDDYTWEHMNDKHNRYSHVRVVEQSDARVIVHWRYAPVDVNDELLNVGERDELGIWIDEYYYLYPDAAGVRKVSWQTGSLNEPIQFQESIPLVHPGQTQGDVVEAVYATVGNLQGQTQILEYVENPVHDSKVFPDDLTIQMHHFRSDERPFIVFEPGNRMSYLWDLDERSLSRPGSSSHWPVGRIWSDGRTAQAPDRATSFLGFPISEPPVHDGKDGRSHTRSLYGMTSGSFEDVVTLARSWSVPPELRIDNDGFESLGYDHSQRAYKVRGTGDTKELQLSMIASADSPIENLAVVIENWGEEGVSLQLDGLPKQPGDDFRYGHIRTLDSSHLIVWLFHAATQETRIRIERSR